jgi:hypothetical protein
VIEEACLKGDSMPNPLDLKLKFYSVIGAPTIDIDSLKERVGNTVKALNGTVINIRSDSDAERLVLTTAPKISFPVTHFVLEDEKGERCTWEYSKDGSGVPVVIRRSPRYEGLWETGPNEVMI